MNSSSEVDFLVVATFFFFFASSKFDIKLKNDPSNTYFKYGRIRIQRCNNETSPITCASIKEIDEYAEDI